MREREQLFVHAGLLEMLANPEGQITVLGIDHFNYPVELFVAGRFNTPEEAIAFAQEQTIKEEYRAMGSNAATIFSAYKPNGVCLGNGGYEWGSTKEVYPTYTDWQRAKKE